jgi:predicted nucleotidyltransferase
MARDDRLWHHACMADATHPDPVLREIRDAVADLYGPALDRVVLFGSRARGDAREESDYDVAVFLRDMASRGAELKRLSSLGAHFMDSGIFIQAIPFRADDYHHRTPIMHEIRKDGRVL